MFELVKRWYLNKFSDPNAVTLLLMLLLLVLFLYIFGQLLLPVLVALVIAYLLELPVSSLQKAGLGRLLAVLVMMSLFVGVMTTAGLLILPLLWQQLSHLLQELPVMVEQGKSFLMHLPDQYPTLISKEQVQTLMNTVEGKLLDLGHSLVSFSLTSLRDVVAWLIYLILVPLLTFFMLKDKQELIQGVAKFVPKERRLIRQVSYEMDHQIMNYIRGKLLEIILVGSVSFVVFWYLDLRYAALLSALVGLSVLIPFVGAALVTFPVLAVALFQFGLTPPFWSVFIAYALIQAVDGNLLVPILFAEAVNLNPVYIIAAVLLFGGIWGFWGVFFAIPLASLVKALLNAWSDQFNPSQLSSS